MTTFCGAPARNARTFSVRMSMSRARVSKAAHAICGVMKLPGDATFLAALAEKLAGRKV